MTAALNEFRLEPGVYRLGQFTPVSVRDQIVRANYLVEHLVADQELKQATRLLILGAGAAGVTCAIAASRLGVLDVTLVEIAGTVMPLQSKCQSRWLDPVQYDWPAGHWSQHMWPIEDTVPRQYTAVAAPLTPLQASISEDWAIDFQNRSQNLVGMGVTTRFHTEVLNWSNSGPDLEVSVRDVRTGTVTSLNADLIVLAMGFGVEHSTLPTTGNPGLSFEGLDFWSTDKFEDADMGIPLLQHGVLVSGGGDGALQDFVRLTTGVRAVGEIMEIVWATTGFSSWKQQFSELWHWEDHAARSRSFVPYPVKDCDLLRRLHLRHLDVLETLVKSPEWASIVGWLDVRTSGRKLGAVQLALKCDHFGWCYGLNRTVALIVLEYLSQKGVRVLNANAALKSTAHVGGGLCSTGCWGHAHETHVAQGVSCDDDDVAIGNWPTSSTLVEYFDGLVIRHGIDPLVFGPRVFEKLRPHTVPFHLP
jgi:hypothetical protein